MAETALMLADEQDDPQDQPLDIHAILQADNIVDLLDENEVAQIGHKCLRDFEIDEASRKGWIDDYKRYVDVAMQVKVAKNFPWPKASNLRFPLLAQATTQFQARAYPVIIAGPNVAKCRVLGPDPQGVKQQRAERIGQHMSWQLLYDMPDWEEDTDRMLGILPIGGCVFRKTYYDDVTKRNCSVMVPAEDFVVNYWARSLEATPRYTQIVRLYPNDVRERVLSGLWTDPGEVGPSTDSKRVNQDDDNAEVVFLEQHCLIDLDDDGYAEPYVVMLTKSGGKVVRIAAAFTPETVTMKGDQSSPAVVKIERRCWFTKYSFMPSPDGSFYDMGFGKLLDSISDGINAILNQSIDAGTLQNAQGGFLGSGVNIKGGPLRLAAGEWKRVDVTAGTLRDNILPLNLPGPSPVLMNLLEFLIDAGRGITSVQDILTGEAQTANTPATTTLAQIEQATKVMTAIFKRIHRAFKGELKKLRDLNRENLDEQVYFNLNDTDSGQIGRADYEDKDLDVVPVSDPTMVSDAQRLGRAGFLMQTFKGDPLINQKELDQRMLDAGGITEPEKLLDVPPPSPPPEVVVAIEAQVDNRMRTKAEARAKDAAAAASLMAAAASAVTIGADPTIFIGAATKLAIDAAKEGIDEPANGPGAVPGMEGQPPDGGALGLPQGPADGVDGGMGPGPAIGPGIPADSGAAGGVGGAPM